jgi:hypothetical protein
MLGRDRSYFVKKNKKNPTLILPKSSLKMISSTCSSFWLTTHLLYLVDVFFNRKSAFPWVQASRRFASLFVWGRPHTGASQENEKKLIRSFNFTFRYIDNFFSLNNSRFWRFRWSHLSNWAWNKGDHRYR